MIHKTRGIVLHYIKYTDTSIIAQIYTEKFGRQSYIFSGIRSKKAKGKINYLQALSLLEMDVYYKAKSNIQRISEFRPAMMLQGISGSIVKQSVVLFLAEVLYKSLKEEETNADLFEFLFSSIQYYDQIQKGVSNFHLLFLVSLSKYLGFYPSNTYTKQNRYFDLREGIYYPQGGNTTYRLDEKHSRLIYLLSNISLNELGDLTITGNERKKLLKFLIEYYQYHLIDFSALKSLEILKEVFEV